MRSALILACAVFAAANYSDAQSNKLLEYTASYQASANGLAATASRSLIKLEHDSYRLRNVLQATVVGQTVAKLEQSSEFRLIDNKIFADNYSYQLSGLSQASNAIVFNWDAQIALSSEAEQSWQLPLREGVMDPLSYQEAFRLSLADNPAMNSILDFELIDGDKIEHQQYQIVAREVLDTALGALNTVKLERIRDADDERVTEIWLATDWGYLLARLEQINNSGLHIVLELESAALDGAAVRGMP
jgi:hypothetical protein